MTAQTEKPSDVRYCVTAVIDLLGFTSHLTVGGGDLRTMIGKEAITRLNILEQAIQKMEHERKLSSREYPAVFYHRRINDSIVLVMDLSRYLLPNIGDTIRHGMTADQFNEHFNVDDYKTEEEFTQAAQEKLDVSLHDLGKFLGVIARLHSYINYVERAFNFPGAKTVIATGYRRPFVVEGDDDYLAANFSFSNAYIAEQALKGAGLFVDNIIVQLLYGNQFYRNILRYASFLRKPAAFDIFVEHEDIFSVAGEYQHGEVREIELLRKKYWFQEMHPRCLSYLQVVDRLTKYLNGTKSPLARSLWLGPFRAIQTGPSDEEMKTKSCKKLPLILAKDDIEEDIRVFSELIETGESQVLNERAKQKSKSELDSLLTHTSEAAQTN